ncbi:MAG: deoxyribose-phosphate aldolase [Haloquadratum sp. J07HQX50]|nr:MAG: deoxyribose-phosphate aldolase [Haloquadratum sp. J07HQX50]
MGRVGGVAPTVTTLTTRADTKPECCSSNAPNIYQGVIPLGLAIPRTEKHIPKPLPEVLHSCSCSTDMNRGDLATIIDHTVLGPTTTGEQVQTTAIEAEQYGMNVCVPPCYLDVACSVAESASVVTVIGFPHGQTTPTIKSEAAVQAYNAGADEIDMVLNIGQVKAENRDVVYDEIAEVVAAVPAPVKVIVETALLSTAEIEQAGSIAQDAGAAFLKTSTGFASEGATEEGVSTLAQYLPVKASGGIRSYEDAMRLIDAGAERLGASSGVKILQSAPVSD